MKEHKKLYAKSAYEFVMQLVSDDHTYNGTDK